MCCWFWMMKYLKDLLAISSEQMRNESSRQGITKRTVFFFCFTTYVDSFVFCPEDHKSNVIYICRLVKIDFRNAKRSVHFYQQIAYCHQPSICGIFRSMFEWKKFHSQSSWIRAMIVSGFKLLRKFPSPSRQMPSIRKSSSLFLFEFCVQQTFLFQSDFAFQLEILLIIK